MKLMEFGKVKLTQRTTSSRNAQWVTVGWISDQMADVNMSRMTIMKLIIAILVAPLIPGFLFLAISLFGGNVGEGFWALTMSAAVGYPAMLVLGLPAHLLLRAVKWTNILGYGLAGLLIGAAVSAILFSSVIAHNFSLVPDPNKSLTPVAAIAVLAGIVGALSGIMFWLIARPDRATQAA